VVVAPVSEEFIFRGSLLTFAALRLLAGCARVGFSSPPAFDAASSPVYAIGVVLAWLAHSSSGLRQPIVFHAAFNAASFVALLL
jgi:membrane protease YdiL (CAAX protease family)